MANCRCFWADDDGCALGEAGIQETCPMHMDRVNPETGEAWGPVNPPPDKGE